LIARIPTFTSAERTLHMRFVAVLLSIAWLPSVVGGQTVESGRQTFGGRCAGCHGTNATGGELGPGIVDRVPARTDEELTSVIRQGLPTAGMPAFPNLTETDVRGLIAFLR